MKSIILLFLLVSQIACGFYPVYRTNNRDTLYSIEITPIASIEGTYFYNHLKTILPTSKNPKYTLKVTLAFIKSYNIIQLNSDILRESQNITVNYQLINKKSSQVFTSGNFTKLNSYSVSSTLYSHKLLREDSINLLSEDAAIEVRNRLIMFFASKKLI